jgi:HPt (histidine-containing phosphotransfer) domain-containing protein
MEQINKHIIDNNFKEAGILLHQLKGSAGNVRAKEVKNYTIKAEEALASGNNETLLNLIKAIEENLNILKNKSKGEC